MPPRLSSTLYNQYMAAQQQSLARKREDQMRTEDLTRAKEDRDFDQMSKLANMVNAFQNKEYERKIAGAEQEGQQAGFMGKEAPSVEGRTPAAAMMAKLGHGSGQIAGGKYAQSQDLLHQKQGLAQDKYTLDLNKLISLNDQRGAANDFTREKIDNLEAHRVAMLKAGKDERDVNRIYNTALKELLMAQRVSGPITSAKNRAARTLEKAQAALASALPSQQAELQKRVEAATRQYKLLAAREAAIMSEAAKASPKMPEGVREEAVGGLDSISAEGTSAEAVDPQVEADANAYAEGE